MDTHMKIWILFVCFVVVATLFLFVTRRLFLKFVKRHLKNLEIYQEYYKNITIAIYAGLILYLVYHLLDSRKQFSGIMDLLWLLVLFVVGVFILFIIGAIVYIKSHPKRKKK